MSCMESRRNENWDIYIIDLVSGKLAQVTEDTADDRDPTWQIRDGFVGFASNRGGSFDLYFTHPRWETPIPLATDAINATSPLWFPDAETMVFASPTAGEPGE